MDGRDAMARMSIRLENDRNLFKPGETLRGQALWALEKRPRAARVSLFWHTMGKGTEDSREEGEVVFENPGERDKRAFSFRLPPAPYSFSGTLVSLAWGVELSIDGEEDVQTRKFILSPFEDEITL